MKKEMTFAIRELEIREYYNILEKEEERKKYACDSNIYSLQMHIIYDNSHKKLLICKIDDKVVGGVIIVHTGFNTILYHLVVDKEYRRKGIGAELIKDALDYCRRMNWRDIMLQVRVKNKGAIKFYEKLGFTNRKNDFFTFSYKEKDNR